MADFNDELFAVVDKSKSSLGTKKKGPATSLKRKKLHEPTGDLVSSSKRTKKEAQPVSKEKKLEVVVIDDSSDEIEEQINVPPAKPSTYDKPKDNTDG